MDKFKIYAVANGTTLVSPEPVSTRGKDIDPASLGIDFSKGTKRAVNEYGEITISK